jgi:hypothetical protein
MSAHIGRREFITLLGGAAAAWPVAAAAEARPRIAILTVAGPQEGAPLMAAFVDGLRRLGYAEGRNVDVDYRYAAGDVERLRPLAQELIALKPECWSAAIPAPPGRSKASRPRCRSFASRSPMQ